MINQNSHPVEWALLVSELDEASEHLDALAKELAASGNVDEADFSVQLGHVYAHLNRAWNSRNLASAIPEKEWTKYSRFPADLKPCG